MSATTTQPPEISPSKTVGCSTFRGLIDACIETLAVVDEAYQATGFVKIAHTSHQRLKIAAAIAAARVELERRDEHPSCPFCGSSDFRIAYYGQPAIEWFVQCAKCRASGPPDAAGRSGSGQVIASEAINSAWNLWSGRV